MQKYESLFITNIPSFYKLNLYNEINKCQPIFVLFTGDNIQERTNDFFLGSYNFHYLSMSGMSIYRKIWTTISILYKVKYKELIIGGWDSLPLWIASFCSRKSKNATVIESSDIESNTSGFSGWLKKIYMSRMSKVYASGKSQVRLVRRMGFKGENVVVTKGVGIFNYVAQPQYKRREVVRNFIYVGRLAKEKNLKMLIKVFNDYPFLNLTIVGYGYQEKELKSIAKDNIVFKGSVNNKDLSLLYQSQDVFVLPSKVEPWGLVVEEALNNGLPVLLSNHVGCADELLQEGENGLSFTFDSMDSLNSALQEMMNVDKYNKMALNISKMNFEEIEKRQIKCYLHG